MRHHFVCPLCFMKTSVFKGELARYYNGIDWRLCVCVHERVSNRDLAVCVCVCVCVCVFFVFVNL